VAKLCLIFGAVLMMVSGVSVAGSKALGAYLNKAVPQDDLLPDEIQGQEHRRRDQHPVARHGRA
jgi:hypothetical protein